VRSIRRTRRPLVALVALVLALAIGYGVKACDSSNDHASGRPGPVSGIGSVLSHTGERAFRPAAR
jgi:hypothetical protein